ncbi:hypothetical protein ACWES4_12660 [Streptomyces sp. NPDC004011]
MPSAGLRITAHRPCPNRERARRQTERHNGTVTNRALARTDAMPPALRLVDGFRAVEYRLSTR